MTSKFKVGDIIYWKSDVSPSLYEVVAVHQDSMWIRHKHWSEYYTHRNPGFAQLYVEEDRYLFQPGDKVQLKLNTGLVGTVLSTVLSKNREYLAVQWAEGSKPVIELAEDMKLI